MSKINKFVSTDEIISSIYRYRGNSTTVINPSDLFDWIKLFLEKVKYPFQYKRVIITPTTNKDKQSFKNYKWPLPKDFYELEYICVNGVRATLSHYSSLVNKDCCIRALPPYFKGIIHNYVTEETFNSGNIFDKSKGVTYDINDNFIEFNVKEGKVIMQYKAIAMDEKGIPLIPDTELYKNALIWFLVERLDYIDWRSGMLNDRVFTNTQQEYSWSIGQLTNSLKMPNEEEMKRLQNTMIRFNIPDRFEDAAINCSIEICGTCDTPANSCGCNSITTNNVQIITPALPDIPSPPPGIPLLKGVYVFDGLVSPLDNTWL